MNPNPAPALRDYARIVLQYESRAESPGTPDIDPAARVFEALRQSFLTLVGVSGFRVLLSRALTLANAETPALSHLQVNAEGFLESSRSPSGLVRSPEDFGRETELVLIAHLFALISVFIGEALLLQILLDVWPHSGLSDYTSLEENRT